MKKRIAAGITGILLILLAFSYIQEEAVMKHNPSEHVVVIDPGHGGIDPGKVGVSGSLEKNINLDIALKVKAKLEKKGITVVMTRTSDQGLYGELDSNKKTADMRKRIEIIEQSKACIGVSIHQNSFPDQSVKGSQVFYYTNSTEGSQLAKLIQNALKIVLKDDNHRQEKANQDYYMLRKSPCPMVIVECGFLSNPTEEALLSEEDYQSKIAKGICKGIMDYLKSTEK